MADLHDLLVKTSRTFGISIPLLPEPTRREVTVAYLLFRIADTFEDGALWPVPRRLEALRTFQQILLAGSPEEAEARAAQWLEDPPCEHDGYLELLAETPFVMRELQALSAEAGRRIARHSIRTARGMASYVERTSEQGELHLRDLEDLRHYCYVVAGIVGEMLTDLFLLRQPALQGFENEMIEGSHRFGEGLQLVNVLKDSAVDSREGRRFLPAGVDRAEVESLARAGLDRGVDYILLLQKGNAPRGFMSFLVLPLFLAWATLERLERDGPGSKLERPQVIKLLQRVSEGFAEGAPLYSRETLRELYASAA